jgi:cytochrome c oxidase subunit 2
VGSRTTIAAGTLPSEPAAFRAWIARTRQIKPGVHMPAFAALPDDELAALAAYLAQLE